jgi:hypothetical protein
MKRYTHDESFGAVEHPEGELCKYANYLALKAALREALDGWEEWVPPTMNDSLVQADQARILELRTQFLDD